jgi:hypothetical protein
LKNLILFKITRRKNASLKVLSKRKENEEILAESLETLNLSYNYLPDDFLMKFYFKNLLELLLV